MTFSVGQRVARVDTSGWSARRIHEDQVLNVHKNGNFTLKSDPKQQWRPSTSDVAHKTGGEGWSRYSTHVEPWTPATEREILEGVAQRGTNKKVNELLDALTGRKTGQGDFLLTEGQKTLVDALLFSLKKTTEPTGA